MKPFVSFPKRRFIFKITENIIHLYRLRTNNTITSVPQFWLKLCDEKWIIRRSLLTPLLCWMLKASITYILVLHHSIGLKCDLWTLPMTLPHSHHSSHWRQRLPCFKINKFLPLLSAPSIHHHRHQSKNITNQCLGAILSSSEYVFVKYESLRTLKALEAR